MTKTRESLSIALALTFFGAILLMPEPAQAQNCIKNPTHPRCVAGPKLATVSLNEDPLTGELGAFVFEVLLDGDGIPILLDGVAARNVTIRVKQQGGTARSSQTVEMTRPAEDFLVDGLAATWDAVFDACPNYFDSTTTLVKSIFVGSDDWSINFIKENNEVRLVLDNLEWSDGTSSEMTHVILQLIADADYALNPILPADDGTPSVFTLTRFRIAVFGAKKNKVDACLPRRTGDPTTKELLVPSTLSITASP